MRDRKSRARPCARARVGGERVALHDDERRPHVPDHRGECVHEMPARGAQIRLRGKGRQLDVGLDVELGERAPHGIEVLSAVHDDTGKRVPVREFADDRRELDALRPRARDDECHFPRPRSRASGLDVQRAAPVRPAKPGVR